MTSRLGRGLRRFVDSLQRRPFRRRRRDAASVPATTDPGRGRACCRPTRGLHHPQATRELALGGERIAFRLTRVRRRSIGFVVDADGLTVRRAASGWRCATSTQPCARRQRWILAQARRAARARRPRSRRAASIWRDGATIAYLGETADDRRSTARRARQRRAGAIAAPPAAAAPPRRAAPTPRASACRAAARRRRAQIRDAVQSWLQRQARRVFDERCRALRRRARRSRQAAVAVVGADALGQRQRQRLGAAALAADPLRARDDRLRRRPRARAPARDEPQRRASGTSCARWCPTTRRRARRLRKEGRVDVLARCSRGGALARRGSPGALVRPSRSGSRRRRRSCARACRGTRAHAGARSTRPSRRSSGAGRAGA